MDEAILVELKKMNEFLERIDWKLWNLHQKYADTKDSDTVAKAAAPHEEYADVKPLATATKTLTPVKEEAPAGLPVIPKYPTVEKV